MLPLTCRQTISQFAAYLDGTLSASDEGAVDAHLDQCDACTARLDGLMAGEERWRLTPSEHAQTQRMIRAAYELSPEKEAQGIETIMAQATPILEASAPLAWAAADTSEMDDVRQRLGAVFAQRGPIDLPPYTADLYVRDQHSALLVFNKDGQPSTELDGCTIEFCVGAGGDAPSVSISQTIEAGVAAIEFNRLHLTMDDYAQVRIRVHRGPELPLEGGL